MTTGPGGAGLLWLWAVVAELGPGGPPDPPPRPAPDGDHDWSGAGSAASRHARIASPGGCPRARPLTTDSAATTPAAPAVSPTAQL
jgi:hypothetical protein